MRLALSEVRRSRLRFGLLSGAVALLVFLVLFLSSLSIALVDSLTGAIENGTSKILVYNDEARFTLDASRLDPALTDEVAAVDGVEEAAPWRTASLTAEVAGDLVDITLFGFEADAPGEPPELVEGDMPVADDEIVLNDTEAGDGLDVGDTVVVETSGTELTIVGLTTGVAANAAPTAYLPSSGYSRAVMGEAAEAADAAELPANAITVRIADDADGEAVAGAISREVDGVQALDREAAAASIPGVDAIGQSFGLIIGIAFAIVVLVVGFFFLILTVQKLRTFLALRALGASISRLAAGVLLQISLVVAVGVTAATGLLAALTAAAGPGFPITFEPLVIAVVFVAVLLSSLLAGLVAIRRITRLDPAQAPQLQ